MEAQGLSELGFALLHKQIPEEEYLRWARESFELSSLDMKFFQTHPAPIEIYTKLKDTYSWGPEFLPIAEWDDHLMIVGLEKPTDFPPELRPIFLLAPIEGLLKFWTKLKDDEETIISEGEETDISTEGEMPDGFTLESTATQRTGLSFNGIQLASSASAAAVPPPAAAQNSVKPLTPKKHEIKPVPAQTKSDNNVISISMSSITNPGIAITHITPKVPPPSSSSPEIKAEPKILEGPQEEVTIAENFIKEIFSEYKKNYEKQLYVEFNDSTKTAFVKYWPNDFVATETPSKHSLKDDSFLAIISKTQKPYHGYLTKNAVTDKFFKEVNSGHYPENITLVPIIKSNMVVGAFMGWGPKHTYNLTTLRDMEKVVQQLYSKLGWAVPEAA